MRKPSTSEAEPQSEPASSKPKLGRGRARSKRNPDVEIAFGARIRTARISAGLSQTALGAPVGITFQQVQKYEKGADRIAASTLQGLATVLGIHPGSFYDDAPMPADGSPSVEAAIKAAEALQQIRDPRVLRQLSMLAQRLAEKSVDAEDRAGIEQLSVTAIDRTDDAPPPRL
jgi:transcriptional regulator with XRE-family HTH domain